jgi:hypothetical protein
MTDQALVEQVRRFFETYANTFDSISIDGAATFAQLYHAPSVVVRGDGSVHCLQSREELQAFFQKVADGYYREGYRGGGPFTNLDVVAIGTRSALATMDWELLREDKTVIRRWRQSYNLLRAGTEWRVLATTFHQ